MKVVVLGGGNQGRIIAADLARSLPVTVADLHPPAIPGVARLQADLARGLDRLIARFDVAVCALPSHMGLAASRAAITARRPMVDIAFSAEDPFTLDREARRAGVAVLPDCGLSPGISNLIIGHLGGRPRRIRILVGGIAEEQARDYVITWSPDDLVEEYVRPARIVRGGRLVRVPALSGTERIVVPGVGELEAFYSDGLRTLIRTVPARDMCEKTLRWPGHAALLRRLESLGALARPALAATLFRAVFGSSPSRDLVVLDVRVDGRRAVLVARPAGGISAMARTTALTCAAMARLVARGGVRESGVLPPELIGRDPRAYAFIRKELASRGVQWSCS